MIERSTDSLLLRGCVVALPVTIGRLRLLSRLGRGGMAEVFLAELIGAGTFQRRVVAKRIRPELVERLHYAEMFEREATTLARLNHPNIVSVHDFVEIDDERWLLLEHVDGPTLAALASTSPTRSLPFAVACAAAADAARALHVLHAARDDDGAPLGLVHRDVSPDNIAMTSTGVVKLLDFGIVKGRTSEALTTVGALKGKFPYMSPEQIQAQPLDGRSDLFSLGVTLYALLCGQRPFRGPSDVVVMTAIVEDDAPPPSSLSPDAGIPRAVDELVLRLLKKDPDERFADGAAVADALTKIVTTPSFALARVLADSDEDDEPTRQARSLFTARPPSTRSTSAPRPAQPSGWLTLPPSLGDDDVVVVDEASGLVSRLPGRGDPRAEPTVTVRVPLRPLRPPPPPRPAAPPPPRVEPTRQGLVIGAAVGLLLVVGAGVGVAAVQTPTPREAPPIVAAAPPVEPPIVAPIVTPTAAPVAEPIAEPPPPPTTTTPPLPPPPDEPTSPRAPIPRPRAAPGLLTVLAIPAAEVFVDGKLVGHAPVNDLKLDAGRHRVRLVGDNGELVKDVVVKSGRTSTLKVPMP